MMQGLIAVKFVEIPKSDGQNKAQSTIGDNVTGSFYKLVGDNPDGLDILAFDLG
jgi:hypothetical protein